MQKWEYKDIVLLMQNYPHNFALEENKLLRDMGGDGWELVTILDFEDKTKIENRRVYYFKRPLNDQKFYQLNNWFLCFAIGFTLLSVGFYMCLIVFSIANRFMN